MLETRGSFELGQFISFRKVGTWNQWENESNRDNYFIQEVAAHSGGIYASHADLPYFDEMDRYLIKLKKWRYHLGEAVGG